MRSRGAPRPRKPPPGHWPGPPAIPWWSGIGAPPEPVFGGGAPSFLASVGCRSSAGNAALLFRRLSRICFVGQLHDLPESTRSFAAPATK
jgi:hypothetical protein